MNAPRHILVPLAAALLVSACTHSATQDIAFESAVQPTGAVIIDNFAGVVRVTADPNVTRVEGIVTVFSSGFSTEEAALEAVRQVTITEQGDADELVVRLDGPALTGLREVHADLDLRVPIDVVVSAFTARAGIIIFDALVDELVTDAGGVDLINTAGDALVRASAGPVAIDGHDGDVDARTSNADLSLFSIRGNLSATTTNGFVSARVSPPRAGEVFLATTNNGVDLALPIDFGARFGATTTQGSIFIEDLVFQPTFEGPDFLEGILVDGAGLVDVRTTNADIRVHRR